MKYAVLLLALMFAGVATPSMAQKVDTTGPVPQKLTFEFEGKTIEVAKKDFPKPMNWGAAKKACKNLGNGWRLPSIEELTAIDEQLYQKGKGKFSESPYWSSSVYHADDICIYMFSYGPNNSNKHYAKRVRAVRTLP
jgi:hypothetical protein